jgi:hypothetical protein
VCPKVVRKRRGCRGNRDASKHRKTSRTAATKVVSYSLEESDHTKSDIESRLAEVVVGSRTNIEAPSVDQPEEIVDVTSLSPSAATVGATLVDPLNIDYSEPEPESDEDCAAQA